jgi:hypothetical protein
LTVGGARSQTAPRKEAGSLTGPWWQLDRQGLSQPLEIEFFKEGFSKEFNDSHLYGPRRRMMVLTKAIYS